MKIWRLGFRLLFFPCLLLAPNIVGPWVIQGVSFWPSHEDVVGHLLRAGEVVLLLIFYLGFCAWLASLPKLRPVRNFLFLATALLAALETGYRGVFGGVTDANFWAVVYSATPEEIRSYLSGMWIWLFIALLTAATGTWLFDRVAKSAPVTAQFRRYSFATATLSLLLILATTEFSRGSDPYSMRPIVIGTVEAADFFSRST